MLLHELDEDKNPARHYVLGNEYIGLDHNYYLTDEQGSVRYVLDAAGNVQNDYRYDAFGQRIAGQENIPNRLRYNAQIEDDLTGLYNLRARYYNTDIGRFTQEDVIYNDGLNLYAYCSSNPDVMNIFAKTTKDNVIPSGKDFVTWFDGLTSKEVGILYSDKQVKMGIQRRLRNGGGKHEWLAVSKAPKWKKWGISVSEVLSGVTSTKQVKFKNIVKLDGTIASGPHGVTSGGVSNAAHKELFEIIDTSDSFSEYKKS